MATAPGHQNVSVVVHPAESPEHLRSQSQLTLGETIRPPTWSSSITSARNAYIPYAEVPPTSLHTLRINSPTPRPGVQQAGATVVDPERLPIITIKRPPTVEPLKPTASDSDLAPIISVRKPVVVINETAVPGSSPQTNPKTTGPKPASPIKTLDVADTAQPGIVTDLVPQKTSVADRGRSPEATAPHAPIVQAAPLVVQAAPLAIRDGGKVHRIAKLAKPEPTPVVTPAKQPAQVKPARQVEAPRAIARPQVAANRSAPMTTSALQGTWISAEQSIDYGFSLATRGAVYSADEQFKRALTIVSQGLDVQHGSNQHTKALSAALTALEEADDLAPAATTPIAGKSIADLVVDHSTNILTHHELENISAIAALQRYYQFAREQLVVASGSQQTAAQAMYGLGRVHAYLAKHGGLDDHFSATKAATLYRAAVIVDPDNYEAANELGVMLATFGHWDDAQQMLENSVRVAPKQATINNLAAVLEKRGDHQLAERIRATYAERLAKNQLIGTDAEHNREQAPIRWISHNDFARQSQITTSGEAVVHSAVMDATHGEAAAAGTKRQKPHPKSGHVKTPPAGQNAQPKHSLSIPIASKLFSRYRTK
ncbi:MAG: hypothetical protein WBF93_18085 [Pirellulales bacterium]